VNESPNAQWPAHNHVDVMLLRKFIAQRLAEDYAQPSNSVIGCAGAPINFSRLLGGWHWRRLYARAYKDQEGQWLTPVELFKPYYSNTLAEFVVSAAGGGAAGTDSDKSSSTSSSEEEVHIVELGGGRGTNAALILSHLHDVHPTVYDRLSYTIFDASPSLHELQQQVVSESGHGDKCSFVLNDMTDVAEGRAPFLSQSDVPTVAIALELLDNLAHDKVSRCRRTRALQQAEVVELAGEGNSEQVYNETFEPISDPLLEQLVENAPAYVSGTGRRPKWVPTVACGVIRRLFDARPRASLLMADFDWLPQPEFVSESITTRRSTPAEGEPIITSMEDVDHACYLASPRLCDILYPTDFPKLADYVRSRAEGKASVKTTKQSDFLLEYGSEQVDKTRSWISGFTPLLDDFSNYSVVTAVNERGKADEARSGTIGIKMK